MELARYARSTRDVLEGDLQSTGPSRARGATNQPGCDDGFWEESMSPPSVYLSMADVAAEEEV